MGVSFRAGSFGAGEPEVERGARSQLAFDPHGDVGGLGRGSHDRQSQSRGLAIVPHGRAGAVVLVEDVRQLGRGDADALVGDRERSRR